MMVTNQNALSKLIGLAGVILTKIKPSMLSEEDTLSKK